MGTMNKTLLRYKQAEETTNDTMKHEIFAA
jgi:hypothetical protein